MNEKEIQKTVMQTCKEYYSSLDRTGIENITPERGKEIFMIADTYRGMHENKDYYISIDKRFESAVQKLMSSRNGLISLTNVTLVEKGDVLKHQTVSRDIVLKNDAEKILFIIRSIDPNNTMYHKWAEIIQTLSTDTDSFLISASQYAKARKLMMSYCNGFFDLKLILDEHAYLTQKGKMLENNFGSR